MLVCDDDYAGNDIDDPLSATELSSCIDLCTDKGIECMGVYFAPDYELCRLKSKMMRTANSGALLWSAVRTGRPGPASPSSQLLVNGDFVTKLSPWAVSSDEIYLSSLIWENGAA
jgi:hypothetical protein